VPLRLSGSVTCTDGVPSDDEVTNLGAEFAQTHFNQLSVPGLTFQ
jgi:hypothetical protein